MRIVLDTNVFVSGVFFSGPPYQVLQAWRDDKIRLVVSPGILTEYQRVGARLASKFPGVDLSPFIDLLIVEADVCSVSEIPRVVSEDPDDDKFIACALAGGAKCIVSGDRHLLKYSGYGGIEVLKPREFVDRYL